MLGCSYSVQIGRVVARVIHAIMGRGARCKVVRQQHPLRMQVPGREAQPGQHGLPNEPVGQGGDHIHHAPVYAAVRQLWQACGVGPAIPYAVPAQQQPCLLPAV